MIFNLPLQGLANLCVLARPFEESLGERFEIQSGAAADDDIFAAIPDLLNGFGSEPAKQRRVKLFIRIDDVYQKVRDAFALGPEGLPVPMSR